MPHARILLRTCPAAHQQAVATETPSSRKSTSTADRTVAKLCHTECPNLRSMDQPAA